MPIETVIQGIESKEGLMLLISQMINSIPNDQDLGEALRKNFKDYPEGE